MTIPVGSYPLPTGSSLVVGSKEQFAAKKRAEIVTMNLKKWSIVVVVFSFSYFIKGLLIVARRC